MAQITLKTAAELRKEFGAIAKAAQSLVGRIQGAAADTVLHIVAHGDVTLADEMCNALGKGLRASKLRDWFIANGACDLPKGAKAFKLHVKKRAALQECDMDELHSKLMSLPWQESEKEDDTPDVIDCAEVLEKALAGLEKRVSKEGVTVAHRDLLTMVSRMVAAAKLKAIAEGDAVTEMLHTVTVTRSEPEIRVDSEGVARSVKSRSHLSGEAKKAATAH